MIAIEIREPGGPEVLVPVARPRPVPGRGDVLVKVAAAGVNRPDVMQRKGLYPPPPGASDIPGLEIAGEVVELGAGATRFRINDKVAALVTGGGRGIGKATVARFASEGARVAAVDLAFDDEVDLLAPLMVVPLCRGSRGQRGLGEALEGGVVQLADRRAVLGRERLRGREGGDVHPARLVH